jgi:DNA polymerase III gamma/tau subunit
MNIGHKSQKQLLEKILKKQNHHAFVFEGPELLGKYSMAYQFAQALTCNSTEINWNNENQRVEADILLVEPIIEEKNGVFKELKISVEQIREVIKSFNLSADKNNKVLIIRKAEMMSNEAQNALLKTLEEPPKNSFLVLITSELNKLLSTISSRAFKISFNLLAENELKVLTENSELINKAMGRPKLLEKIIANSETNKLIDEAVEQLNSLAKSSFQDRIDLAEKLSKQERSELYFFLQVWVWRIRQAAHKRQEYKLLKVAERVENTYSDLRSSNVNVRLILEDLFFRIA